MPYALLLFGAVMLVAGLRDTHKELWELVKGDFTQEGGFITWVAAIAVVGGMGYVNSGAGGNTPHPKSADLSGIPDKLASVVDKADDYAAIAANLGAIG